MQRMAWGGLRLLAFVACTAAPVHAQNLEVPLALGAGPAWVTLGSSGTQGGSLAGPYTAIRVEAAAVLDRAFLERNVRHVPPGYRRLIRNTDEIRLGSLYVPRTLILSRATGTSLVGATWDLVGMRQPIITDGPVKLDLTGRLVLAAARLDQSGGPGVAGSRATTFIRPGVAVGLGVAIALAPGLNLRFGMDEAAYVPQAVGGGLLEMSGPDGSLWRMGSPWAMVEFRVPYNAAVP